VSYALKEIFPTLQGEGFHTGRAAVFARFAGCNLWSGREVDRATAACRFCDTDFVGVDGQGGGRFTSPEELADTLIRCWQGSAVGGSGQPFVVFTGGEPMLQLDTALISACHQRGLEVAIETNGTLEVPASVDWICVSPKPNSELVQQSGHELKLVFPHEVTPEMVADLAFEHFFLQPMDGAQREQNTEATIAYCRAHPQWRLSLQTHKMLGIP
jgi:7-carboxy-7-deazaguanine synthase (Cx14CxxC type)